MVERHAPYRRVRVSFSRPVATDQLATLGEVSEVDGAVVTLQVPKSRTTEVTARLLTEHPVEDVRIEDPLIEDVIREVFSHR